MADDDATLEPCPVVPFDDTRQDLLDVLAETLDAVLSGEIRGLALITEDADGGTSNRYVPCDTLKMLAGCELLKRRIIAAYDDD